MRSRVLSNFIWGFMERCGAQSVSFLVSLFLARLLEPEDYGVVALVLVFTSIMQTFVDSGMGTALVQKKDADDLDFSSVFFFNIAACVVLYLLAFLLAPWVARFYNIPELTAIFRVLSLVIVVSGIKNVQQAYVSRHLMFRRFFFSTLGGTLGAAVLGIWMAYCGFGVWALVAQMLFNTVVDTLILWITVKWRPKLMFSLARAGQLFSFGWKILISSLLETIYIDLRQLVIGKLYTTQDLAFYNKGSTLPNTIGVAINGPIGNVLLPVLSAQQDSVARVRAMTKRAIKISTYTVTPLLFGLAACAEPAVRLLLTEKWLPCVPYIRVFCLTCALGPIHTANHNALKAIGRSDFVLKLQTIKIITGCTLLVATVWAGPMGIAVGQLINGILTQFVYAWPNKKLLGYFYTQQIKDIFPAFALSCVMGLCVWPVHLLSLHDWQILAIQVPLGAAIYLLGSKLCRMDSFEYLWDMLRQTFRGRKIEAETRQEK